MFSALAVVTASVLSQPVSKSCDITAQGVAFIDTYANGDEVTTLFPWPGGWIALNDPPTVSPAFQACLDAATTTCGQGKVKKVTFSFNNTTGQHDCSFECDTGNGET